MLSRRPVSVAMLALLIFGGSSALAVDVWPQFRGPRGDGLADEAHIPLRWSETQNVTWKTPIHGRGWSSPVIWDNQIWMTTATEDGNQMYAVCVARDSGKILHDIKLFEPKEFQITHPLNSFASPTPVVEPGRVYIHFGTYGTACLDTRSGKILWSRTDLNCDHFRGPGSSPILYGDLLICSLDGIDVQYVVALEKNTGRVAWKVNRSTDFGQLEGDLRKAYTTPQVIEVDGQQQLISTGAQATYAYCPKTGRELWTVRMPGFSNVMRPLFAHGLVFVNSGYGRTSLVAIRPDGKGDVTDTHIAWKYSKSVGVKPSPILVDDLLYTIHDRGILTCLEAKTGDMVWKKRLGGEYSASPLFASGRIYFFSHEGPATVIRPGRKYEELAVNQLDAGFMASPAVIGDTLFLRTKTHLYRIEQP